MSEAVGIRLQRSGRVFYFDPVSIDMEVGDLCFTQEKTFELLEFGQLLEPRVGYLGGGQVK